MFTFIGILVIISVFIGALVIGIIKKNKVQERLDAVKATRGIWKVR